MAIKTQQSISGFIVGSMKLEHTSSGDAMLTARVGQDRFERTDAGGFNQLDPAYFDIAMYRATAERAFVSFKPGDRFVAEGYVHEYEYTNREGQQMPGEEFVVKKIGHDTARTRYNVDRSSRRGAAATGQEPPEQGVDEPDRAATAGQTPTPVAQQPSPQPEPSFVEPADAPRHLAVVPANGISNRPEPAAVGMSR